MDQPAAGADDAALGDHGRRPLTDWLTGLFSRGFLEATLVRELARCRRHGLMVSLVLVDLDDFTATNARFGQGTGDAVLRAMADLIPRQLRAADISCRFGSDEFAIVLPDTYPSGALLVAERIVSEVRHLKPPVALTVSVGVATYGAACATYHEMIDAADRALCRAKAAGGDSIAVASAPQS